MDQPPASVLIVGSGVFGLGSALALTKRPFFANTTITVVDDCGGQFPPEDAASIDSSRIVRADYSDPLYTKLAAEAQDQWRKQGDDELGGEGRYSESGFLLTANETPKDYQYVKSGKEYVQSSWRNVVEITEKKGLPTDSIITLESRDATRGYLRTADGTNPGDWGYVNGFSGWANAGKSMKWLYEQVKATGRVTFVDAKVQELATEGDRVVGAKLADSTLLKADVVLVAAGAWSGGLIDLRGRCEATGHVLAYMDITPDEAKALDDLPVVLNLSTGLFVIPPQNGEIKFARHTFGYVNPTTVPRALPLSPTHKREPIVASLPYTTRDHGSSILTNEADAHLRSGIRNMVHIQSLQHRPWKGARICWYSDTRNGDWLVDWHPGWKGLFVATGDSGHGFKFLPNVGDKIVDTMQGKGGELAEKWQWKDIPDDGVGCEVGGVYKALLTEDGSRGGEPLVLKHELAKGRVTMTPKAKL